MDYLKLSLDQLRPNPNNPRVHSKKQTRQIADSSDDFRQIIPLLQNQRATEHPQ